MKKITFIVGLCLSIGASAFAQQLPNSGFENWGSKQITDPVGFTTSNFYATSSTFPVSKVTDAYHGTNALKLTTIKSGSDTIVGSIMGNFHYTGTPDSITGWVKGSVAANDSAIFSVNFLKSGVSIAQVRKGFSGTQSTYKRFSFPTKLVSSNAPDSLILTISSSKQNNLRTAGSTITIDSITFKHSAQQLTNSDFESWTTSTGAEDPTSWGSTAGTYPALNAPVTVTKTTDAHSGTYAIKVASVAAINPPPFGAGVLDTIVGMLQLNMSAGKMTAKIPFTYRPDSLISYVKGTVVDMVGIYAALSKNGTNVGTAFYFNMTPGTTTDYARKATKISYTGTDTPDSISVLIFAGNLFGNVKPGNELYVDDLSFAYINTGLSNHSTDAAVTVFTDATSTNLEVMSPADQNLKMAIYNINGQSMNNLTLQGNRSLDISHYPAGMYLYRVLDKTGATVKTGKFVCK